jgi:hypothetical protein
VWLIADGPSAQPGHRRVRALTDVLALLPVIVLLLAD